MRIFKFGGASVKDAEGVRNVVNVLLHEKQFNGIVVISAMGKMTNAFEKVAKDYFHNKESLKESIDYTADYHQEIIEQLFKKKHPIFNRVAFWYSELSIFLANNHQKDFDFIYDQIVGFGELISTTIVSEYLNENGIENEWLDVRSILRTDATYREAKVNWEYTECNIKEIINPKKLYITQGFLGGTENKITTTLGREGSDYTAGIFAYYLNAFSLTIWKDVDGVYNADPKEFLNTIKINQISYEEAIEMAFYGASVIHPKTIQPIQDKEIPLFVKSFLHPSRSGTKVSRGLSLEPNTPCFILKKKQILVSISTKDFSFIVEENISYIFKLLHQFKLKVNMIQNSAISFSVCINDSFSSFKDFYKQVKPIYNIEYQKEVDLYTIRHFDDDSLRQIKLRGKTLLSQINKETAQIILT